MEAVLVDPLVVQATGQRQAPGDLRHTCVKTRVETRHLRYPRPLHVEGVDHAEGGRHMERSPGRMLAQVLDQLLGDQFGAEMVRPAMDHPVSDRLDRRQVLVGQGQESGLDGRLVLHVIQSALGERLPGGVDEPQPALTLPDPFHCAPGQELFVEVAATRPHLVEMELQRRRTAVDA